MTTKGNFFIFEGPDGTGKTSIMKAVAKKLCEEGQSVVQLSFPGKEDKTLGALVYDVHHNNDKYFKSKIPDASKQTLHIASHIDSILNQIIPALKQGQTVMLDRCWWSTYVYGNTQNIPESVLESLISIDKYYVEDFSANYYFLIIRDKTLKPDEIDSEGQWNALIKQYLHFAKREEENGEKIIIIENNNPVDEAIDNVLKHII